MPLTLPAQILPLSGDEAIFNKDYAFALLSISLNISLHITRQSKDLYLYHCSCHLLSVTHLVAFKKYDSGVDFIDFFKKKKK